MLPLDFSCKLLELGLQLVLRRAYLINLALQRLYVAHWVCKDVQLAFVHLIKARTVFTAALIDVPVDPLILLQSCLLQHPLSLITLDQSETQVILFAELLSILGSLHLRRVDSENVPFEYVLRSLWHRGQGNVLDIAHNFLLVEALLLLVHLKRLLSRLLLRLLSEGTHWRL